MSFNLHSLLTCINIQSVATSKKRVQLPYNWFGMPIEHGHHFIVLGQEYGCDNFIRKHCT